MRIMTDTPKVTQCFRAAFRYCLKTSPLKSQKEVARKANIADSTLSEMMTKKSFSIATQNKIANAFGYDLMDFLMLGRKVLEGIEEPTMGMVIQVGSEADKGQMEADIDLFKGIPLYESGKLAAGESGMIFDPFEEPASSIVLNQRDLIGRKNHRLVGLKVGGQSMVPVIPLGSVVIIDLDDRQFADNKIFAVNYEENIAAVKLVQKWKHGFVLISSAPAYPPVLSDLDWGELCVGRGVSVWKSLDDM
jgi:transcriptional regulator with XRE-family HTH domain